MLVDGGGRPDYGSAGDFEADKARIVNLSCLSFCGTRVVESGPYNASHADADHIQGLVDVARTFGSARLILPMCRVKVRIILN